MGRKTTLDMLRSTVLIVSSCSTFNAMFADRQTKGEFLRLLAPHFSEGVVKNAYPVLSEKKQEVSEQSLDRFDLIVISCTF